MIDQRQIDLMTHVGVPLKRVANTRGGEFHGPCPVCGGKDRFVVQPQATSNGGRCMCRQCHPQWMDAIGFIQWKDRLSFSQAVAELRLIVSPHAQCPRKSAVFSRPVAHVGNLGANYLCFNPEWQLASDRFVTECSNWLWDTPNNRGVGYLRRRLLSDAVIQAFELGWNPFNRDARWGETKVWLPRGIVIPWQLGGAYWRVRIRRWDEDINPKIDDKYINASGSANGLYRADSVYPKNIVVMVEGELDALTIDVHAQQLRQSLSLVTVATGGTNNARLLRWVVRLSLARHVFLAFDNDENGAGDRAASYWQTVLGAKASRLRPTCHDVNDMAIAGKDISDWIIQGVAALRKL